MYANFQGELERAILLDDEMAVRRLLQKDPKEVLRRFQIDKLVQEGMMHWVYAGDTWLHLAAAGHCAKAIQVLLKRGASVDAATSRRRATPLHYAADGNVVEAWYNSGGQVKSIRLLVDSGADVTRVDAQGATPLHRAVRSRSWKAVVILLDLGAQMEAHNHAGSTCFHLAVQNTGRGGSGKQEAIEAQSKIIGEFLRRGADLNWKGARGKTVLETATSSAGRVRELLSGTHGGKNKR